MKRAYVVKKRGHDWLRERDLARAKYLRMRAVAVKIVVKREPVKC
jgi:hypothetical protein